MSAHCLCGRWHLVRTDGDGEFRSLYVTDSTGRISKHAKDTCAEGAGPARELVEQHAQLQALLGQEKRERSRLEVDLSVAHNDVKNLQGGYIGADGKHHKKNRIEP